MIKEAGIGRLYFDVIYGDVSNCIKVFAVLPSLCYLGVHIRMRKRLHTHVPTYYVGVS